MLGKLTQCPICHKFYYSKLRRHTDKPVQEEFPDASPMLREQLISGICSNKCWDAVGLKTTKNGILE